MTKVIAFVLATMFIWGVSAQSSYNFGLKERQAVMPRSNVPYDTAVRKPRVEACGQLMPEGDGEYVISGGWSLIEGCKTISQPVLDRTCDLSEWYNATVPGTVLTTLVEQGIYPDPYVGLNNMAIPDTLCRMDWWYRTEFGVPDEVSGRPARLIFNGINYRAQVWLNSRFLGTISGAFVRGVFEVGELLRPSGNILAVRILPPDNPGIPQEQTMADFGPNGGMLCLDGPTFFASEGWDWMPAVRDRNIGIWQDVRLRFESSVAIETVRVQTDLLLPDTTLARLSVRTRLTNRLHIPQQIMLNVRTEGVNISKRVSLDAQETREIVLRPEEYPALTLHNPRLWWPNGYGQQPLYELQVGVRDRNGEASRKSVRFGVREMSYELMVDTPENANVRIHYSPTDLPAEALRTLLANDDRSRKIISGSPHTTIPKLTLWPESGILETEKDASNPYLVLRVNGVRVFCKGGNWGMDDALKRVSRERLEPYVRLHKEENFNMIRNWNGQCTEEALYELCDEYGILVWNDFFMSTEWWNLPPADSRLFLRNTADVIERFANHPCIALWCSGNETYAPAPLEEGLKRQIAELDGTRHYQGNSRYHNLMPSGPWCYMRDYGQYYNSLAGGFNTELGAPSMPTYETLCKFIKPGDLWPMNDVWAYHDALFTGWIGWKEYCEDIDAFGAEPCRDAEEFCRRAQVFNYNAHRVMFEAWNGRMWENTSGLLYWMSHPAWYSVVQQSYSHDYKTFGTYFGLKKGSEPVHVQWEPDSGVVRAVNASQMPACAVDVRFCVYATDGRMLFSKTFDARLPQNAAACVVKQELAVPGDAPVLVRVTMADKKGNVLSSNDYWCDKAYSYAPRGLHELASSQLKIRVVRRKTAGTGYCVSVENTGQTAVPYIEMNAVDAVGHSLLPLYLSDSYFNLLPGEKREIRLDTPQGASPGRITICADGLNANTRVFF